MSSDKVIAEIAGMRADVNAALEVMRSDLSGLGARIEILEATTAASIDALAATTAAHLAAVEARLAMLTWVVIAAFTILTAITVTGFYHMNGWRSRGATEARQPMSKPCDE